MYNRYIPQSDGSYRRSRVQEDPPGSPQAQKSRDPEPAPVSYPAEHSSIDGFLKTLLPKEFDTGDLLIVLLLLLMAEHREEDKNTALLTLALYFLM